MHLVADVARPAQRGNRAAAKQPGTGLCGDLGKTHEAIRAPFSRRPGSTSGVRLVVVPCAGASIAGESVTWITRHATSSATGVTNYARPGRIERHAATSDAVVTSYACSGDLHN